VRRRRPDLLAVEPPAFVLVVALGLELHRRGVAAGVGLAVPHGELDLGVHDLGQELLLQLVAAVPQDRLADDADALADLRRAASGERLVEQVLIDPVAVLAAPLLRPGDTEPATVGHLLHERATLGGVDDLRHVFPRRVGDVGHGGVLVEKGLDLREELALLRREVEVHGLIVIRI
jgi:hypothetical protein